MSIRTFYYAAVYVMITMFCRPQAIPQFSRLLSLNTKVVRPLSSNTKVMTMSSVAYNNLASANGTQNNGDLNNTSSMRVTKAIVRDENYAYRSLAIPSAQDDPEVRSKYRPFNLDEKTTKSDWISRLELATVIKMAEEDMEATGERLRVLVLYGSLRKRCARNLS